MRRARAYEQLNRKEECLQGKTMALTGLEIAPVSGAFANKDFAFATKISPLVAILRPFYSLAYK